MKNIFLGLVCPVLVLTGCANTKATPIQDPVGPQTLNRAPQKEGSLVVYTPTYAEAYIDYPVHSNYEIYTKDGVLFKKVRNNQGNFDPNPEEVSLPVGEYKIKSESKRDGTLLILVVVKPSRKTVVDLNEETEKQFSKDSSRQLVHSPSGDIIGCRVPQAID